eukprot:498742-Alexandrium_andersonii.AAC.1
MDVWTDARMQARQGCKDGRKHALKLGQHGHRRMDEHADTRTRGLTDARTHRCTDGCADA